MLYFKKGLLPLLLLFCLHSGILSAQTIDSPITATDSLATKVYNPSKAIKVMGIAVPMIMITYGVLSLESHAFQQLDYSTRNEITEDNSFLYNKFDDYLQFSPAVLAFGLKLGGVESTHKLSDMAILYALSNILETAIVYTTKQVTYRERPDDSNSHSFPSGHTATAFVAAEFLHQEYKNKSVWISVGGYGIATLIGASRVYNNKHWVSDVITGAGIGILSTKIVYWTYPYLQKAFGKKDKKLQTFIFPAYTNEHLSLNASYTF